MLKQVIRQIVTWTVVCVAAIGGMVIAAYFFNGNDADQPAAAIKIRVAPTSAHNVAIVKRAAKLLVEQCPALAKYAADISSATAKVHPASTMDWVTATGSDGGQLHVGIYGWMKLYGWRNWIKFEFQVVDQPTAIPQRDREWGQHLYYTVGGGMQPGINTGKSASRRMCSGRSVQTESNWSIIAVPQMTIVDSVKSIATRDTKKLTAATIRVAL